MAVKWFKALIDKGSSKAPAPGRRSAPGGTVISRRAWLTTVFAAVLLLCGTMLAAQTITLLHVNDTHSHLDRTGPKDANLDGTMGGIAKAATVIGTTRAAEPNLLVLHAGDVFHGDLLFNQYFGVPEFMMMQQLGFDAMAVGNHEFDYGPDPLAYALSQAYGAGTLPLLSANLDTSAYPALDTWIKTSTIKTVAGVKVGIFGMTVPNVPTSMPDPVVILGGDDPTVLMQIAGHTAGVLRAQGAQVVIMLSHLGYVYDQAVATNVPGIDIIVGGHDHYLFQQPHAFTNPLGKTVYIVQAGCQYQAIGKMHFTYASGGVTINDYAIIPLDQTIPDAPTVAATVAYLKQGVVQRYGDVYHTVVATATHTLSNYYDPTTTRRDTAMGNLITDAMRDATGTDIAITANGLISEGITAGPVVGADIFRPVSYGYDQATGLGLNLATFKITGEQLMLGLAIGLQYVPYNEDIVIQTSGLKYNYDSRKEPLYRLKPNSVMIHGQPVKPFKKYTVTTNSGVAMLIPKMGIVVTDLQILPTLEYNALKAYIQKKGTIDVQSKVRIKDVGAGK